MKNTKIIEDYPNKKTAAEEYNGLELNLATNYGV